MARKGFALLIVVLGLLSNGFAQGRGCMHRYDPKLEAAVRGTIGDVQETTGMRGAWNGTHLVLKTDTGDVSVHLGPASFIAEKQFSLAKGDTVEVLGSKITMGGEEVIVAREITKGDKTLVLRDAHGIPKWSVRTGR